MIGKSISHYRILERLGEGGMGVVYKAEDTKLKRIVALKFLPARLTDDPEAKARFIQEAQAASALDHSNICSIHEIGETGDGQTYIVMGYYSGETLQAKLDSEPLSLEESVKIAIQVAQGLTKAHGGGIVHRDIKPANIFLSEGDEAKIIDFGLAKLAGVERLTEAGSTVGTAAYMSPEQAKGEETDHRTDIWSLGVMLFRMVTGKLPFTGEYQAAITYSIIHADPLPLSDFLEDPSDQLQAIISKALEKDPAQRYQNADNIIADLKAVKLLLDSDSGRAVSTPAVAGKRRLWLVASAAVLILALAGIFSLFQRGEEVTIEPVSIAVISFENQTGDTAYDYLQTAIPSLLITSLEQSPNFRVTTLERLRDLLKQTDKGVVEVIDKELGFELCRMEGVEALVLGSFIKAGDMFATDIKVLDVNSKSLLKSTSARGSGVDSILISQIDELGREISRGFVVSGRQLTTTTQPRIADVTTTSWEAYRYYLKGLEASEKYYDEEARYNFEQAVKLDPSFAAAYLWLGMSSLNITAGNEAYEKAKTYSDKATEKEKLYINARYALDIERDSDKYLAVIRLLIEKYPREKSAHTDLGFWYRQRGIYDKAVEKFEKVLELDPYNGTALNQLAYTYSELNDYDKAFEYLEKYAAYYPDVANPLDSMAEMYVKLGQLDEAMAKFKQAQEVRPDWVPPVIRIAYLNALKEDYTEALRWVDRFIGGKFSTPSTKAQGHFMKGFYYHWLGKMDESISELDRAAVLAEASGRENLRVHSMWLKGYLYFDMGELESSRKYINEAIGLIPESSPHRLCMQARCNSVLGLIELKAGEPNRAGPRLVDIDSFLPLVERSGCKKWISILRHSLHSEILLREGAVKEALDALEKADPLGLPRNMSLVWLVVYNKAFHADLAARIYREKGDLDSAIAEYERLITFDPDSADRRLVHPKYYYMLGILYEQKGLKTQAIEQYRTFLELWKEADDDLPEPQDAAARLARLTG